MLSNLGTVCLQFQELLVPKIGINASDARNCKFPLLGISDSETLERMLWNLKPRVPNSGKRQSPKIGGFQVPGNFRFPKVEIIMSSNLKDSQSYLREFGLPKGWAMFPSFDTSFISKDCDLGVRLNKNFCNKPLLFCLMVRQKDVLYMHFDFDPTHIYVQDVVWKKRPWFCLMMINGPASRKALVEKQVLHIGPTWKHVL